jgi:hypothetical protein
VRTGRDRVLTVIVTELSPLLGQSMAGSAARMHLEKLGIAGSELDEAQVDRLLVALAPGLHVFLGRRSTEQAIAAIRSTLRKDGTQP